MYTYIQRSIFLGLLFTAIFIFQGCSKDEAVDAVIEAKPFELYLTDCPFEADEVNVEIVSVILENDNGDQETLITNAGIYNLLDFTDGIDTLLAFGTIPFDDVNNIYIELGDQNTIKVDGETFPLDLEGEHTVKINVDIENLDQLEFLVDFFACTSIVQNGDGFSLHPVIIFKGSREEQEELVVELIENFESCYELVYPISFLDKNGTVVSADNQENLIGLLIDTEIKDIIFPLNLTDQDGDLVKVNSLEEANLLRDCDYLNDNDDAINSLEGLIDKINECYDITFPISLIDDLGNTLESNNEQELIDVFENNEIEDVVFPIHLIDENGDAIIINSAVEATFLDLDC